MSNKPLTGQNISRIEGTSKVTGAAKYSGEYNVPNLLFGYVVNSRITKGKITAIHSEEVKKIPGVVEIFSHKNRPSLAWFNIQYADMDAPPGTVFEPLANAEIKYNGQPIALVVAESFEMARYAASVLRIEYDEEPFTTNISDNLDKARLPKKGIATLLKPPPPKPKGDFNAAYNSAFAKASGTFVHATEHHNPMELFTTTAIYEGKGKLTIYDKTQGTINSQLYVANVFGLHMKNVRVISTYVGGGFGSGLRPQYQLFMSVLAALQLKRPVRVTLDRQQMFTFGHRPQTIQHTRFGADASGKITALNHAAFGETSRFEDYTESVVSWCNILYPSKNTLLEYKLVPVDLFSPLDMRAPGGSTALHAVEATMDELAYRLNIDPLELRLINYSKVDDASGKPYTSKELKKCYLEGAEKFGWKSRDPKPRSMKRGNKLIGYGMATGIWDAMQMPVRVRAAVSKEGKLALSCAVTDIGTGTLTVMTQIAADQFRLPLKDVTFLYGDSRMPFAPIQGGSFTTVSIGDAVIGVSKELKKKMFQKAKRIKNSFFNHLKVDDVLFENGNIVVKNDSSKFISFTEIIEQNDGKVITAINLNTPHVIKLRKYSRAAHTAAFAEVEVDEELGVINVTRMLTAVAAGKIINPKTARSQILGGMVWSLSKVLQEETVLDHHLGKYMNSNLAEYHIPVHADIHELDVIFVEEDDSIINELGSKGVGEIGLVGMPPAVANAIYHATGKRINKFPIHFNDVFEG